MRTRDWLRLYRNRKRSQRFQALPVSTRGLFAELLTYTDDHGRILIGSNDRSDLWRYIGAHPRERRTLSKHLDALIANGSIRVLEHGWDAPSFSVYQPPIRTPEEAPEEPPDERSADTGRALGVHWACTGRALGVHEVGAKSAETHDPDPTDKRRERGEKEDQVRLTRARGEIGESEARREAARKALRVAWHEATFGRTGISPSETQLANLGKAAQPLADWMRHSDCPAGATVEDEARRAVGAFLAVKWKRKRPPYTEWLAADVVRWLDVASDGDRKRRKAERLRRDEEAKRERERQEAAEAVSPPPGALEAIRALTNGIGGTVPPLSVDHEERARELREQARRIAAGGAE